MQNSCSCEGLCPGYYFVSGHRPGLLLILHSTILEAEQNSCAVANLVIKGFRVQSIPARSNVLHSFPSEITAYAGKGSVLPGGFHWEDIVEEKYGGEQMIVIEEDIKENGILRSFYTRTKTFYDYFRPSGMTEALLGKTWQVRG